MTLQIKLIAVIALLLTSIGLGTGGFVVGNKYGTNAEKVKNHNAAIASRDLVISLLGTRVYDNEQLALAQATAANLESQRHADELETVRARAVADAGKRVPIDRAKFCGSRSTAVPQAAAPGSTEQENTAPAFLPESFASDLRQLAVDADEIAADLRTVKKRTEGCFAGSGS